MWRRLLYYSSNDTPGEAICENIKKYVKGNSGVNVHTRYIAKVKRMHGLKIGGTTDIMAAGGFDYQGKSVGVNTHVML